MSILKCAIFEREHNNKYETKNTMGVHFIVKVAFSAGKLLYEVICM
ncbi:hypothetical protein bcere0017_8170 [Bacillus cereus Rock1-3]|nr:hypothetical protein MC28_0196 [Bacillus thuringiensis MC28]EEL24399.1 hypothetical protein bcere0017_8170 [Bacillus cereus Rock1-3]